MFFIQSFFYDCWSASISSVSCWVCSGAGAAVQFRVCSCLSSCRCRLEDFSIILCIFQARANRSQVVQNRPQPHVPRVFGFLYNFIVTSTVRMWEHAKKKKKRHFSTAGCIRRLYYLMICLSLSLIVCSIWKSFCTFQLFLIAWFPASYCFTTSDQPSVTSNLLSAVVVTLCAPFYSFSNSHSASLKNLQPPSPPMPPPAAPPPAQFTRRRLQGSALY